MLYIKIKNFLMKNKYTILLFLSLFLYATGVHAEVFGALDEAGKKIFSGLRSIIYPAATIGIACVCISGMFGNFNWKWLAAIMIGVFVIAYAAQTVELTGEHVDLDGAS